MTCGFWFVALQRIGWVACEAFAASVAAWMGCSVVLDWHASAEKKRLIWFEISLCPRFSTG